MTGSPIGVGLLGLGNVGGGVAEYLHKHGDSGGLRLVGAAVKDLSKPRDTSVPYVTDDAYRVIRDPDVQILVELVGGEQALEYHMEAIEKGKSLVTANKLVIARYAPQIFEAARRKGVDVGFEASVGGGIPIVQTLREDLAGNKISVIRGIVNGTTNYILTRMGEGMKYEDALEIAQQKGFAETDPTSDVSGEDARYKLAILSSLAWNAWINPASISCEGIPEITPQDFDYAGDVGYTIKLLATARTHDGKLEVRVNPALIRGTSHPSGPHPLSGVRDEFNAIYLEGDLCGPQLYYGRGAGRYPTTSAVVADIRRLARNLRTDVRDDLPTLDGHVELVQNPVSGGYIRASLEHVPGTAAKVFDILGRHGINVMDSLQRRTFGYEDGDGKTVIPDIITIEPTNDSFVKEAMRELATCDGVHGKPVYLRIEE
ncbi:MAG: homoserine dehydrogenase [Candidatus Aenigmarchaeota archaeon]|nr:homoserine dehydrogenase [Candidatus Aenigmarchaeota archaeon]